MLVRNLAVQVKDKITDKWDYFDVKATLPENPADLDKVFGARKSAARWGSQAYAMAEMMPISVMARRIRPTRTLGPSSHPACPGHDKRAR